MLFKAIAIALLLFLYFFFFFDNLVQNINSKEALTKNFCPQLVDFGRYRGWEGGLIESIKKENL